MDEFEKKAFMAAMGWRVRSRREYLKMSQEELAIRLNYKNKASISRIEAGLNEIPQSKMKSFALALDTTVEYLMGWDKPSVDSLTQEELEIIRCFRAADERDKNTIRNILGRYREDTAICPDCGTREALASLGCSEEEQLHILDTIHSHTRRSNNA